MSNRNKEQWYLFKVALYVDRKPRSAYVIAGSYKEALTMLTRFGNIGISNIAVIMETLLLPGGDKALTGEEAPAVYGPFLNIVAPSIPTPTPPASKGEKASLTPTVPNVKEVPDYEPAVTFYNADTWAARLVSGDIDSGPAAPPPVVEKAAEAPATDKPVSDPLHRPWMDSEFRCLFLRNSDERWATPNPTQTWEQLIHQMDANIHNYGCAVLWLVRNECNNIVAYRCLPADGCFHCRAHTTAYPHGHYQCDYNGKVVKIGIGSIRVYKS